MKNHKKTHQFKKRIIISSSTTLAALCFIGVEPNIVKATSKVASNLSTVKLAHINKKTQKSRHFNIKSASAGEENVPKNQTVKSSSTENISSQSDSVEDPQTRAEVGTVTVYYKNEAGKDLAPSKVITGNVGDSYTAPMFMTNYYRVKEVIGNKNGTFTATPQEVTYIYTDEGAPVTIVNEDENGGPIYNSKGQIIPVNYITGKIGTAWTSIPIGRKGYIYKGSKAEGAAYPGAVIGYQGNLRSQPGKITYIYSDKAAPITVHYLREDNSKIIADEQVNGRPDYDYDIKPKVFSGYTLKETKGKPKGTFSDKPQEVTFIYAVTPEVPVTPAKISSVIVRHQDENGNSLAPDQVLTGKVGDGYVSSAKEINGYTLKARPDNATGFFTEMQQIVTYIYIANNENKPITPVNPATPSTNENNTKEPKTNPKKPKPIHTDKKQPTANKENKPIHKDPVNKATHLPRTGSDKQSGFAILTLGLLSLFGGLGGYFLSRKKRNNS